MDVKTQEIQKVLQSVPDYVYDYVVRSGVPTNLTGFNQLCVGIHLILEDPTLMEGAIHKGLYTRIAEIFDTTNSRVERNLRHAIEVSFDRLDFADFYKSKGYIIDPISCKMKNSEYLSFAALQLRKIHNSNTDIL